MGRLLILSNRLPITARLERGKLLLAHSPGGLATSLRGPHQRSGGLWLGWPGDTSRFTEAQRQELLRWCQDAQIEPLFLSGQDAGRFYEGFSNRVLWPLFHYLLDRVELDASGWDTYQDVNQRFADRAAELYRPGDLLWIHDYQLCLAPAMIRARIPEAKIGFFLHIPFPSSEVFRILPWRRPLLEGLLGADVIGFHTLPYARHFASSLMRLLGLETELDTVRYQGRAVQIRAFPLGVDAAGILQKASRPEVRANTEVLRQGAAGRKIILGIDRLDYTKGMIRRLLSFERLLQHEPSLVGKVRLVQIAVPSRERIDEYQRLKRQFDEHVGRINSAYGGITDVPIHYLYRSFSEEQVLAFYQAADVMLVNPLRDGMNLVAKEFIAARHDEDGVLVLSEFAGAAHELGEALLVNPYDLDQTAGALRRALEMPAPERQSRMRALRARVSQAPASRWAESFLDALQAPGLPPPQAALSGAQRAALLQRASTARRLLLLLDYDGTLVQFATRPEDASPDDALYALLRALAARPGCAVHLVSGRAREDLQRWFGELPLGLHAEHGFWSREGRGAAWTAARPLPLDWLARVEPILALFTERTPGSFIEKKSSGLTWHYRGAEPEFASQQARELRLHLWEVLSNLPVQLLPGNKALELRAQGIHKGNVVARLLAQHPAPDALLAIGDDRTDEDMFTAVPPYGDAIHIGPGPSRATLRLNDPASLRALLWELAKAPAPGPGPTLH